jgi:hypothetical protein
MQPVPCANENLRQSIKTEHYRLHVAEEWPDSPYKEAVLAAVRSTLERLEATAVEPFEPPPCMVCASRLTQAKALMFPSRPKGPTAASRPAA